MTVPNLEKFIHYKIKLQKLKSHHNPLQNDYFWIKDPTAHVEPHGSAHQIPLQDWTASLNKLCILFPSPMKECMTTRNKKKYTVSRFLLCLHSFLVCFPYSDTGNSYLNAFCNLPLYTSLRESFRGDTRGTMQARVIHIKRNGRTWKAYTKLIPPFHCIRLTRS